MTTAQEWMTREVRACRPDSDLGEAARLMWEEDCGVLPVIDGAGKLVGMVTDRDVAMASFLRGCAPAALRVETCMASRLHACAPTDPIERVIRVMADRQVRRVPIVDGDGGVRGILSLNDLVRRAMTVVDAAERARISTAILEALAAIGEPHRMTGAVPESVASRAAEPPRELAPEPRREPERAPTGRVARGAREGRGGRGRDLAGSEGGARDASAP